MQKEDSGKTEKFIEKLRKGTRVSPDTLNSQVGGGGNGAPLPPGKTGEVIKEIRTGHSFRPGSLDKIIR